MTTNNYYSDLLGRIRWLPTSPSPEPTTAQWKVLARLLVPLTVAKQLSRAEASEMIRILRSGNN